MKALDPKESDPKPPRFNPILKHDDDDHVDHIDERWLVSYADMMTLLFGLFVMLYSMSTNFEEVQSAMTKQFAQTDPVPEPAKIIDPKEFEELKSKLELLTQQMDHSIKENDTLKTELIDLSKVKRENEKLKQDLAQIEKMKSELANSKDNSATASAQILELKLAKEKLEEALKEKQKPDPKEKDLEKVIAENQNMKNKLLAVTAMQKEVAKLTALNKTLTQQLKDASREPANVPDKIPEPSEDLQKQVDELKTAKEVLEKQLKDNQEAMASMAPPTPFAAVVITWPTADHDIDLILTDPEGKTFNFKERSFSGHPGQFVLDSRRGPGAEMWQTDRTLAGTYTIKYVFYNTYGNAEPATVLGTIYSARGMYELPKVKLNFDSKREQIFRFSISKKGEITLLK